MFYNRSESEFPEWRKVLEAHAAGGGDPSDPVSGGPRFDEDPAPVSDPEEGNEELIAPVPYDSEVIQSVWEFGEIVDGIDSVLWRKDEFGDWIYRLDYGNRHSRYGWEIFDPGVGGVSRSSQGVFAMRPMQWKSFIHEYEDRV